VNRSLSYAPSRLAFAGIKQAPLPRCEHGIYLAREDERRSGFAWYCATCRPQGFGQAYHYGALGEPFRKMSFALRYQSSPRRERLTANKSERNSNCCPQCGSSYRFLVENPVLVECAECSTNWRPLRRSDSVPKGVAA
jgi:ribosomal protein L37AE/L43A